MNNAAIKQDKNYIGGVPQAHLMRVWPRVEPILKRVVKYNTGYATEHVLTELQLGTMQLWVVNDFQAVAVTSVLDKPLYKVLFIPFLAGDNMSEWIADLVDFWDELAEQYDCKSIEFEGRKGWGKIAAGDFPQYKPLRTTFRREIDGRR